MLIPVNGLPIFSGSHAKYTTWADVFINFVNIRIGMVKNVMLHFPVECISSNEIQRKTKKIIHPGLLRIRTMVSVVHNRKTDARNTYTHNNSHSKKPPRSSDHLGAY